MTPRLSERLSRLERASREMGGPISMPSEVARTYLRSVAVALGSYPTPPAGQSPYFIDTVGDGFARALGYLNYREMALFSQSDPDDWRERLDGTFQALRDKYVAAGKPGPKVMDMGVFCLALDDYAHAKADGAEFDDNDALLAKAMAHYSGEIGTR